MPTTEPNPLDAQDPARPELPPATLAGGPGALSAPPTAPAGPRPRYATALGLFALTLLTTTTLGAHWTLAVRTDRWSDLAPWGIPLVTPDVVARVWQNRELLGLGLAFAVPTLLILLAHELGHYLACRYYRVDATLPYFLPVPAIFGTLGAFIRIRAPIRDKKTLFDIGIAGPLAGFAVLLPFLLLGIARSQPASLPALDDPSTPGVLLEPGKNLAIALVTRFFHGPLAADQVLDLHPFALAAWFGLLATALNLLPLSQLDGGHILYATVGARQRRLALPLWLAVAGLGWIWPGWLLWAALVFFLGLRHPPVRDESVPLGPGRRALAVVALLVLVLSFMPSPLREVPLPTSQTSPAALPAGQVARAPRL